MIKCNVASIESLSTKDGPGIRSVIFLQGCPLRCKYCHNPEMWSDEIKHEYSVDELFNMIYKFKPYYGNNGGITVSGGEPLLQSEFLIQFFKKCKENGISTCLDTSGVGGSNISELLSYTDIVLFDIKHTNEFDYMELCGVDIKDSYDFIDIMNNSKTKVHIRQVIIPDYNDNISYIHSLKTVISDIKNIESIEFLPFHTLANDKYIKYNIHNPMAKVSAMDITKCKLLYEELLKDMK